MKPLLAFVVLALSACAAAPRSGGYYKDDGPGENPPANLDQIADAQPKAEPLHRYANRPYQVFGKEYVPLASVQPYRQRGVASWYGKKFHGQRTASGETYDMYAMTAAHTTLPIPSYARVTRVATGRSVIVRINDRGPFHQGRMIDLSYAAALKLGFAHLGSAEVELESIEPGQAVTPTQQAATTIPQAAAPTLQAVRTFSELNNALDQQVARWDVVKSKDVPELNLKLKRSGLPQLNPEFATVTEDLPGNHDRAGDDEP